MQRMKSSRFGGEGLNFWPKKQRKWRSFMRKPRLWEKEHGSITIFLSLVLAFVLAFVAIFIDYSRMAALKAKSERLLHAASRSVMSAYVPDLQKEYGLFAYGDTDPSYIFEHVLEQSLEYKEREDVLPITDAKLLSSSLELSRELGDYEVFRTQINEEMKYKAPVNFAIEVVGRFKPMSQTMKDASGTIEVLEKLQKLYDKREAELDKMLKLQQDAGKRTDNLPGRIGTDGSGDIADTSLNGSVPTAASMAAQYHDYKVQKERVLRDTPPNENDEEGNITPGFQEWMALLANLAAYEAGSGHVTGQIQSIVARAFPPHQSEMTKAQEHLKNAQAINAEMDAVIATIGTRSADQPYDEVSASDIPGAEGGPSGSTASVREKMKELSLSPDFFTRMEQRIQQQTEDFGWMQKDTELLNDTLGRAFGEPGMSAYTLKRMVLSAGKTSSVYNGRYGSGGSVIQEIKTEFAEHRKHDEERKKLEKQAQGELKKANEIIKFLSAAKGHQADFEEVEKFYSENLKLNASAAAAMDKAFSEDDPSAAGKEAMENMDGFFGGMSEFLDATGDRLLQNEYASDHFSNFDFSKVQALTAPGTELDGEAAAALLGLDQQELEYIIYGFGNPGGNIAAAYGEIFAMRLAIRTMEALIDPEILALGNPLVILAKAILQGLINAIADMTKLSELGYVELSNTLKIKLTYKDHLRLFLFAHPANDNRLSRMLALIRFNTGVNPDDHYTYLSGNAAISMPIWFLPGVMKSLKIGEGSWSGHEYTVDMQADYSY
ncbi:hypothetical protein B9G55_19310 [Saccharibacillus sp. O16]|nr:hypothetical protein B9G55_19310 [Saccharibacillus sp. O16]